MGTYLIDTNIVIEFLGGTLPPRLVLGTRQELLYAVSQGLDSTLVVSLPNCFISLDSLALRGGQFLNYIFNKPYILNL